MSFKVVTLLQPADRVTEFDNVIGFQYLKGMHLNDSKKPFNSRLDRHENIGKGYIGLECFEVNLTPTWF